MIIPPFLKAGDKVGVVATAKKVHKANTLKGIELLKSWGLHVVVGAHVFDVYHQFAGDDAQRAADFQQMLDDDELCAIFPVRGGYGTTRIIDELIFEKFIQTPKWICGFSDITALHTHLFKMGIASIHAPMPSFFYALNEIPLSWLHQLLFGKKQSLQVGGQTLNRQGVVSAPLIGGNLSIICHTIGTPSEIITKGNILFIEDVGEQMYHLDRMMVQLKRGGFLNDLAGMIVGQFTEMKDDDPFGMTANEIIYSHISEFNYPIAFNFPFGHTNDNHAVPIGVASTFKVSENMASLELF
jgi:muramoyltetrapeptide carboxypeptidase